MIPDIYIAATLTSILSLTVIGGMLFLRAPREERGFLAILVLVMLPMNALAFYMLRMPLDGWLSSILGKQNEVYHFIQTLYAPITEEPAKLWPLLIPFFYRRMKSIPAHRVGLAVGLGFGVGEAWNVAHLLSKSPAIAQYPWYMLGGYVTERMMVCVMHGAFTASALVLIFIYGRVFLGVLVCMLLHFIGNFPIFLARSNAFDLSPEKWQTILQLWVPAYFVMMGCLLAYFAYGRQWFRKLVRGKVRCPGCDHVYEHPIFGINLFHKRYERCPCCRHWHLVSAFHEHDLDT